MKSERSGSLMMNAGMKTRQDAQQGQQPTGRPWRCWRAARPWRRFGVRPICTCTFSMVTVDSSTRMPIASAMPPSDMMLIVLPVSQSPSSDPEQGQRDVGHDDDHAPEVAEEQEDHQPGQARADHPLGGHALDRRHHGGRLVELEADLDLSRYSLGMTSRNSSIDLRMSATTVNVEAVSFLMIGK